VTPTEAHGAILALAHEGKALPPVLLLCRSESADKVQKGIHDELATSAKRQLSPERPGVLSCYIQEVDDFSSLRQNSGLAEITRVLLEDSTRAHVAAITYSSDVRSTASPGEVALFAPALRFTNAQCKFALPTGFPFIGQD
jgi:hypothetical protein